MDSNELGAALGKLAPKLAPGGTGITGLVRLSGGASQETYSFDVTTASGSVPRILRRRSGTRPVKPADGTSPSLPLATEAGLIRAAAKGGVPVADVIHVCTDKDGIGEAYVVSKVEGETLGRRIVADVRFEGTRKFLAKDCGKVLARIHAVAGPDIPPIKSETTASTIDYYEDVYHQQGTLRPIIEAGFKYLRAHAPKNAAVQFVHGDFRNGNLMIHPEKGVAAVLDWELTHFGDAAEDLGWLCTNSWRFGGATKPVGGFGDYKDLLEGYAEAGGKDMTLDRVLFWQMMGSLKWGVMCMRMYRAHALGIDPSLERTMIGRRTSETEIDLVRLLEAAS
jgi:aminoglycoside phosphotransferase (APT) family kinase protein